MIFFSKSSKSKMAAIIFTDFFLCRENAWGQRIFLFANCLQVICQYGNFKKMVRVVARGREGRSKSVFGLFYLHTLIISKPQQISEFLSLFNIYWSFFDMEVKKFWNRIVNWWREGRSKIMICPFFSLFHPHSLILSKLQQILEIFW